MKRMFPFPFPIVPLGFLLVFLAVWATGSTSSTRGSGFSPLLMISVAGLVIVVGLVIVAAVTLHRRQAHKQLTAERITETRTVIRQQLDAIANDILKLEDEVRASGHDEALSQYRNATVTYADALGQIQTADTATELTALARRLDTAIWQLDTTEAILDETPLPPKPRTEPTLTAVAARSRYQRPAGQRSSVGIIDMISAMLEDSPMSNRPRIENGRRRHPRRHC